MKNGTASKQHTARLLGIASCYNFTAFAGALVGTGYYLPNPAMLSDHLIINDLRYGGALCGGFIAAFLSFVVRRSTIRVRPSYAVPILFSCAVGLGFVLLKENALLGTAAIVALLIPWLVALAVNRRFVPHEARPHDPEFKCG